MKRLLVVLLVSLLLLPACQPRRGGDTGAGSAGPSASGDPADLLLAVTVVSAWPDVRVPHAPVQPRVRVAGDGSFRADVYDADAEEWRWLTGTLPPAVVAGLLAEAADLPGEGAYGPPGLDGSTTSLVLGSGSSGRRELDVWVPEAQRDGAEGLARRRLVAFLERLDAAVRDAGTAWEPAAYLLLTQRIEAGDGEPSPAWPLDDVTPLPGPTDGVACQAVGADVATRLQPALDAGRLGPVGLDHDGTTVGAVLLPVLTDETCADLEPYRWPLE